MTTNFNKRYRNFATIVYPESAPSDWINILRSEIIPFFVSPLHDRDILEDGTPKKPHYHVMLMFDGVKTVEQVKETIIKICCHYRTPQISLRYYTRYNTFYERGRTVVQFSI